jgi:hypothetical protein
MIRQLEFSILQLTQRLDELTNAIQYLVMGSLPANLINPITLHNILKNVSFHLTENYELIAGTRVENIHFYSKFVKIAAIANTHFIKIILNVPMKTAGRHFVLHKIITLPTRTANDTFVQYLPEFPYFGIDNIQHNYILFTQEELSYCNINSISICPAHIPIFNNRLISYESSLFFQTADSRNLCQRKILLKHTTPLLHRYGSSWIFHLPGNKLAILRCHTNNGSTTYTRTLQGNGITFDASACLLTTDQFQTPREILGTAQFALDATEIYVPDQVPIATNHEIQELQEAIPSEVQRLSDITFRLAKPRRVVYMHSLPNTSRTLDRHEQRSNWHLITLLSLDIINILNILGYFLKTRRSKLSSYSLARRKIPKQDAQKPSTSAIVPDTVHNANASNSDNREKNVVFSAYPLQTTA